MHSHVHAALDDVRVLCEHFPGTDHTQLVHLRYEFDGSLTDYCKVQLDDSMSSLGLIIGLEVRVTYRNKGQGYITRQPPPSMGENQGS